MAIRKGRKDRGVRESCLNRHPVPVPTILMSQVLQSILLHRNPHHTRRLFMPNCYSLTLTTALLLLDANGRATVVEA